MGRTLSIALALAAALAASFTIGCGGSDKASNSTNKSISVSDAKAKLSKDCQEGKASEKKPCDCIADELAGQGRSGKQIDDLRKDVNGGNSNKANKEVKKSAARCGVKLAKEEGTGG